MNNKKLLSGGMLAMMEQGFASVTSFLTGILISRATNSDIVGSYTMVLSVSLIILSLQRVVVALPFNVHYPKLDKENEKKQFIAGSVGIEVFFVAVCVFGAMIMSFFAPFSYAGPLAMVIFMCGYLFKDFARQYFIGIGKMPTCLIMSALQCITQIGILFVLIKMDLFSLPVCLAVIGASSFVFPVLFMIANSSVSLKKRDISFVWARTNRTARWSVGISMSDSVKNQLSVWILNMFTSLSSVGIYNNNNTFSMLPQPIFVGLSQFMLPNFASDIKRGDKKSVVKKMYACMGFIVASNTMWILFLLFFGNFLISLIYGKEYVTTVWVLVICSLRGIFNSFTNITSSALQAVEKPQYVVRALAVAIVFMLIFGTIFTYKLGILGMVIAFLGVYIISFVFQIIPLMKALKQNN